MTTAQEIDPFAGAEKAPSVKFPTIGTTVTGVITDPPNLVQSRDFETGELATWPDGNPKMSAVINVEVDGEKQAIWASKPSALFAALAQAQKDAGARFEVGGTIVVRYDSDKPNEKNPRLNAAKQFKAKYTPPAAKKVADSDPFASTDAPPF